MNMKSDMCSLLKCRRGPKVSCSFAKIALLFLFITLCAISPMGSRLSDVAIKLLYGCSPSYPYSPVDKTVREVV